MTTKLRAHCIGEVAHKKLNLVKHLNGVVHSFFDRVINIKFENIGLLSIGKPEIPMSLLHIRVETPFIKFNNSDLELYKNVWVK